jgi:hypothetical protein
VNVIFSMSDPGASPSGDMLMTVHNITVPFGGAEVLRSICSSRISAIIGASRAAARAAR